MIEKVTDNVFRIHFPNTHTCNAYFIKNKKILIDTGSLDVEKKFPKELPILPEDIAYVFYTHLHYDHMGLFNLFFNARHFASSESIAEFKKNPAGVIYDTKTSLWAQSERFNLEEYDGDFLEKLGFRLVQTPGHTKGSICLLYQDEFSQQRILFSGDTIFNPEMTVIGRTDLPSSSPHDMKASIRKITTLKYDILCPGHGDLSFL